MEESVKVEKNRFFINKLHNRTDFFKIVDEKLKDIENDTHCLIAIDIEHFKLFNKWYGREKGDEFLNQFSEILYYLEEDNQGICGYFGGDNFAAFLRYGSVEFSRVLEDLNQCAMDIGKKIGFLPAYGVYKINDNTVPAITMHDMALLALAQVKGNFDNRFCIYNESMTDSVEEELRIISEVKTALDREQFTFFVQPKCNISNGKIVGAEALVRWAHPDKGIVSPGYFIPILEKNGFIGDLDRCVWEMVCKWIRKCIDMKFEPIPISINVSRLDVISMDVPEILTELTEKYNISHDLLRVEITESACAETTDSRIQGTVKRIQNAGFTVLMDDFGSGYSSLNMLKSVMIDVIKIDMKFLDISEDETKKGIGILESVVNMSNSMGIPIIVEGVENKKQEDYLIGMGCHFAQGYYYYKPMPIEEFEKLLIDKDNFDYKGVFVNQSEQVHINEIINADSFSESQFNNILGAVSFFDEYNSDIVISKVNDQFYNLLGTEVDYDITKARQIWDKIFYNYREYILRLFEEAAGNPAKGSIGKITISDYSGKEIELNIRLFLLKNNFGHRQFIGLYTRSANDGFSIYNIKKNEDNIQEFDNEEILRIENVYGNLPFGMTIIGLCFDDKNKPQDIDVFYTNKEMERILNCKNLKVKMVLKKIFNKGFSEILEKCKKTAIDGKSFEYEALDKETGKYLNNVFFQYSYGYIGIITYDITKEHICDSVLKSAEIKDSEFYYVDLQNNSYNLIYPNVSGIQKYGFYGDAIKKTIRENEFLDVDEDEIKELLSINGVQKMLKNKDFVEFRYKYRNSKNTFNPCVFKIIAGQRVNGVLQNIFVKKDKYIKRTLQNVITNYNDIVLFVENEKTDNSAIKNIFDEKYAIISLNEFNELIDIENRDYESISMIILSDDVDKDTLISMFNYIRDNEYIKDVPVIFMTEKVDVELEKKAYKNGISEIIYETVDNNEISERTKRIINMFIEKDYLKKQINKVYSDYNNLSDKYDILLKIEKHNGFELNIKNKELTLINNVYSPELSRLNEKISTGKLVLENFPDVLYDSQMMDYNYFVELKNIINNVYLNNGMKYAEIPLLTRKNKEIWIGFYVEPLISPYGMIEKFVGTYKVITQKRKKIFSEFKKYNFSEFAKIKAIREFMVNLSRNSIVDMNENVKRQWKVRLGKDNVTYSDIVNYIYKNQITSEYKKLYYDFMSPDKMLAKYEGVPCYDSFEYQLYQSDGVKTLKCCLCIMETDSSGDVYAFVKYIESEKEN